jgi:hypothetical protein
MTRFLSLLSGICVLCDVFRKECFTTNYFKGCIDSLMLQDELEDIQSWIKQLHGAAP